LLESLHTYTTKLWTLLCQWRQRRSLLFRQPFLELDFNEITSFVEDANNFFAQKMQKDPVFKSKLGPLSQSISVDMSEIQVSAYALKDLKHKWITSKHWQLIFRELGAYQRYSHSFTLQDVIEAGVYSHQDTVRAIYKLAEKEHDQNLALEAISQHLEKMEIRMQHYRDQIWTLSEFDITQSNLEEYKVQVKKLTKDS
jgi:hypothetical protein